MYLDKFTNQFQITLINAQSIAVKYRNQFVEPLHVMLSLLNEKYSIIQNLLKYIDIDISKFSIKIERACESLSRLNTNNINNIQLSTNLIQILNFCELIAKEHLDKFISSEIFILASLKINDYLSDILKELGMTIDNTQQAIKKIRHSKHIYNIGLENQYQTLEGFIVDITEKAENGELDPVIGRDKEIYRTIQILQRRTKNNPVLIGNPGVGKTSIVEGLAQRIVNNEVPESLKKNKLLLLDIETLIAGIKYRREFENRLKSILNNLIKYKEHVILCIDTLYTVISIGKIDVIIDVYSILKPILVNNELCCIGTITLNEYYRYIKKNTALKKHFQKILVVEPSIKDTIAILHRLKERYELHHNVQITDSAIIAAANLSCRYIHNNQLPDKAIDLIDEAASNIRIQINSKPKELYRLKDDIIQLQLKQQELKKESDDSSVTRLEILNNKLKQKEKTYKELEKNWQLKKSILSNNQYLKTKLEQVKISIEQARHIGDFSKMSELQYGIIPELKKQLKISQSDNKNICLLRNHVTDIEIAKILAKLTDIPLSKILENEKDKLLHMEQEIYKQIVGQNQAVIDISNVIRRNRASLSDPGRPIGSFMFLGPTGVGKTELCKALAVFLFNKEDSLIHIDMSRFMKKHTFSKLIGSFSRYINYEKDGFLIEAVKHSPYSIILLDKIEKAHPDISNILLEILNKGRLENNYGQTINFLNTVIIMISNLGSNIIQEQLDEINYQQIKKIILNLLMHCFTSEFINKIDEIIIFHPLKKENIIDITKIQLQNLSNKLREKGYSISIHKEVIFFIANMSFNSMYGARLVKGIIQKVIENPLSQKILSGDILLGQNINLRLKNKQILIN